MMEFQNMGISKEFASAIGLDQNNDSDAKQEDMDQIHSESLTIEARYKTKLVQKAAKPGAKYPEKGVTTVVKEFDIHDDDFLFEQMMSAKSTIDNNALLESFVRSGTLSRDDVQFICSLHEFVWPSAKPGKMILNEAWKALSSKEKYILEFTRSFILEAYNKLVPSIQSVLESQDTLGHFKILPISEVESNLECLCKDGKCDCAIMQYTNDDTFDSHSKHISHDQMNDLTILNTLKNNVFASHMGELETRDGSNEIVFKPNQSALTEYISGIKKAHDDSVSPEFITKEEALTVQEATKLTSMLEAITLGQYSKEQLRSLQEGFIKSDQDIFYNRDRFIDGDINIAFIIGLSGSGKTSLARKMSYRGADSPDTKIEHYDMDDIIFNKSKKGHDLDFYRRKGELAYEFFSGPGSKFFVNFKEIEDLLHLNEDRYREQITNAFVDFAIRYANHHRDKKFIIEGVWLHRYISPSRFRDYAVCIKGTSAIVSGYRAGKRDGDYMDKLKKSTQYIGDEMKIQRFRQMFQNANKEEEKAQDKADKLDAIETKVAKRDQQLIDDDKNVEWNFDEGYSLNINEFDYIMAYEGFLYDLIESEYQITQELANYKTSLEQRSFHEANDDQPQQSGQTAPAPTTTQGGPAINKNVSTNTRLVDTLKNRWERFVNFISRIVDRVKIALGKFFNNRTKAWLESVQQKFMTENWSGTITYVGDYNKGVNRCKNVKIPKFSEQMTPDLLNKDLQYTQLLNNLLGTAYSDDGPFTVADTGKDMAEKFKLYFLGCPTTGSEIKSEEKDYDLGATYPPNSDARKFIYDFCHDYSQLLDSISAEQDILASSTNEIINFVNRTLSTKAAKITTTPTLTNTTVQPAAKLEEGTQTGGGTQEAKESAINLMDMWIKPITEADNQEPTTQGGKAEDGSADNSSGSSQPNGGTSNALKGAQITDNIDQIQDMTVMLNRYTTVCRSVLTAKFTAMQHIAKQYFELIKNRTNSSPEKKDESGNTEGNNNTNQGQTTNDNQQAVKNYQNQVANRAAEAAKQRAS